MPFCLFRDRRKAKHLPVSESLDMSNKIILVQPMHNQDDATCPFNRDFSRGVGKGNSREKK